jgi:DNA mismatch repair ATPase MutS
LGNTNTYQNLQEKHQVELSKINKQYNLLGTVRLIIGLGIAVLFYFFLTTYNNLFLALFIADFVLFLGLVKVHANLVIKRNLLKALVQINVEEQDYIQNKNIPFADGLEFIDPHHAFSYDLDLFGPKSLYHNLNRTSTYIGKEKLAEYLLKLESIEEINSRQKAVEELRDSLEFRQQVSALGKSKPDNKEIVDDLKKWSNSEIYDISKVLVIFSYILPFVIGTFIILFFTDNSMPWGKFTILAGMLNLGLVFNKFKHVKSELLSSTKVDLVLSNYSQIIQLFENESFQSEKLQRLQNDLKSNNTKASVQIKKLSNLFGQLENIQNPLGAFLINALLLYHLRTIKNLAVWKQESARNINQWLDIIGEIEALNSLANFSYNNKGYCFPHLNDQKKFEFEDLGHPLIDGETRVNNDLGFTNFKFIILTGSNMSGKSTFLRSLGINMILARSGAPICAKKASIHPMQVLVSMRLSDSLTDNESYFFAEVKRLKEIMDQAEGKVSFVLLDEILRGTNSDDKREGTIEVIKKIIQKDVYGAIATHDLLVCNMTKDYPGILTNQNFEVEIINDELMFDYKLREGVCKNKSATFLMKKMEVI